MVFPYIRVNKITNHVADEIYAFFTDIRKFRPPIISEDSIDKYDADKYTKSIDSWAQLVSMLFMHFANVDGLRDISNGMRSAAGNLNHLGV